MRTVCVQRFSKALFIRPVRRLCVTCPLQNCVIMLLYIYLADEIYIMSI